MSEAIALTRTEEIPGKKMAWEEETSGGHHLVQRAEEVVRAGLAEALAEQPEGWPTLSGHNTR